MFWESKFPLALRIEGLILNYGKCKLMFHILVFLSLHNHQPVAQAMKQIHFNVDFIYLTGFLFVIISKQLGEAKCHIHVTATAS